MQAIPNIENIATITVKNKPKSNMLQITHIHHLKVKYKKYAGYILAREDLHLCITIGILADAYCNISRGNSTCNIFQGDSTFPEHTQMSGGLTPSER